jgi:hypothetical protein
MSKLVGTFIQFCITPLLLTIFQCYGFRLRRSASFKKFMKASLTRILCGCGVPLRQLLKLCLSQHGQMCNCFIRVSNDAL